MILEWQQNREEYAELYRLERMLRKAETLAERRRIRQLQKAILKVPALNPATKSLFDGLAFTENKYHIKGPKGKLSILRSIESRYGESEKSKALRARLGSRHRGHLRFGK